jgi:predicted nucleotidyltransferase component of viral defense system
VSGAPRNLPASIRQRLLNLARERKEDFGFVLTLYGLERLLYRLSQSPHRADFVLKGAMLLRARSGEVHRPTRDLDLLGRGDRTIARLERVFTELWSLPIEDGLELEADSIHGEHIREAQEYGGTRVTMAALLGNARIAIQVDIGFGDAVTPGVEEIAYPTLLDGPAPMLLAYPLETVIAEKLQAIVTLGMANTRMKDFYDQWVLSRRCEFEGETVARAIAATFRRRDTGLLTEIPPGLSDAATDAGMQQQWSAFLRRTGLDREAPALPEALAALRGFLLPPLQALGSDAPFAMRWRPAGPWTAV